MRASLCKSSLLVLGAALCLGTAVPASAEVHQLGAVNVSADHYTQVSWTRFDGPVERLSFVPDNDAVDCEHVLVTYRDGTIHDVFSGPMPRHTVETITFPEGDSHIRNVEFACRAENRDGARITLSAVSVGEGPAQKDDDWARGADLHTSTGGP